MHANAIYARFVLFMAIYECIIEKYEIFTTFMQIYLKYIHKDFWEYMNVYPYI